MAGNGESARGPAGFRVGDLVEVKSKEEILATLDERGELDSLPFMPEMLAFCGQQLPVYRRANRLCDPIWSTGHHRMEGAVHLEAVRCDGSAHGGCQAGCLIFWKEEWLRPVGDAGVSPSENGQRPARRVSAITEARLAATTTYDGEEADSGDVRYRCQATEILRAAPERIGKWDPAAVARDVRSGSAGLFPMLRCILILLFNVFQRANKKLLPRVPLIHDAEPYPFISGRLSKTPRRELNLQPGELVRVKTLEEIEATLDTNNRNRGLSFDREMVPFCGREARVLRRVNRIIDEETGRMRELPSDCIVLEDVYCMGDFNKYCTRSIYAYWREIWLERVEPAASLSRSVPTAVKEGVG